MFLRPKQDINVGLEAYRRVQHASGTNGAVLLDVRNPSERKHGYLPGSVSLPLNKLKSASQEERREPQRDSRAQATEMSWESADWRATAARSSRDSA